MAPTRRGPWFVRPKYPTTGGWSWGGGVSGHDWTMTLLIFLSLSFSGMQLSVWLWSRHNLTFELPWTALNSHPQKNPRWTLFLLSLLGSLFPTHEGLNFQPCAYIYILVYAERLVQPTVNTILCPICKEWKVQWNTNLGNQVFKQYPPEPYSP